MDKLVRVEGLSNRKFLERYARVGRVGLVGGTHAVDVLIRRAQRHADREKRWSAWSHAMIFEGVRADGHHWVIESDLDIHRQHIRLGAQENRVGKYFDEREYPSLAVLDFGLTNGAAAALLREGLEMVATRARYSVTELISTAIGLRHPRLRSRKNLFARDHAYYCSALVQHLFGRIGMNLVPGIDEKRNAPEDLFRSPVPHATWLLAQREVRGL